MANILIHPNSGSVEFSTGVAGAQIFNPNFTGGALAARLQYDNLGGINITSYVNITGSGFASGQDRFSIDGTNGRLFSVTDNLAGSLFSVNDIAGLPIIEAFDDNTVIMGAYNKNDFVLTGNALGLGGLPNTGTTKLYVSGNTNIIGNLNVTGNILLSGNPVLTGVNLSAYYLNSNPSGFVTNTNLQELQISLSTGIENYTGTFVTPFSSVPTVVATMLATQGFNYMAALTSVTTTDFVADFSDVIEETGVTLNIIAYN